MQLGLDCPPDICDAVQPFANFDYVNGVVALKHTEYASWLKGSNRAKAVDVRKLSMQDVRRLSEAIPPTILFVPIADTQMHEACLSTFGPEHVVSVITAPDFSTCFQWIAATTGAIAIPHDICADPNDSGSIMALRRALIATNCPADRIVHLLGMTTPHELLWYINRPYITSLNTALPVTLGLQSADILSHQSGETPQPATAKLTDKTWAAVCRNIAILRRFMS